MSAAYQHMVTLLSFVLALGISHQLFATVKLLRAGPSVKWSWVHGIWMFNCFVMVVAWWVGIYDLHVIAQWSVASVLYNFAAMLGIFLAIAFVCPEPPQEGVLDLWQFHLAHRKQYVGFTIANLLSGAGAALYFGYVYGVSRQGLQAAIMITMAVVASIALFMLNPKAQFLAAIAVAALLLVFFFVGDPVLA